MVSYDFYRDVYGGDADEVMFARTSFPAETVLRRLLFPNRPETFDEEKSLAFRRAVCVQADEMIRNGGTFRVKSESLGDRSVTYAEDNRMTVGGRAIATDAVLLLENAGCMNRWV